MPVHAAPIAMDDGSDADMPATASQDRNPPVVTCARRQVQVPKKSTSARQKVQSHRTVPDDEEEVTEEDITDQEDKESDEEDIYGGFDGAVGDALGKEVGCLS